MEKELPDGWEWKKLGDIGEIFSGGTPSTREETYYNGDIPWITPSDLSDFEDIYIERGKKNITEIGLANSSARLLPKDSVIFSTRAPIGYVAIAANPLATNQGFKNIVLNEELFPKYVYYYLKLNTRLMQKYASGTTFLEISAKRFSQVPIVVPPLETQHKIVSILEKAEETKKLRVQADELTQQLLQSLFLEMFGDPATNPKKWEVKELKEFGRIITGNTPSRKKPEFYGNYIEWIKSDNINTPYTYLTKSEEMLSEIGVIKGRVAPVNSVLVTCIAGSLSCIGNAAIADRKVAFNQQINAIVPNEKINELFLYYLILNSKEYIQNHSTQSMKGMISKNAFGSIKFIYPPFEIQNEFARITKKIEKTKKLQQQSSQEIDTLFHSLMQKAFKGELVA